MIFQAALRAVAQIFSKRFRRVLGLSLALTIALLLLVWAGLTRLFAAWIDQSALVQSYGWAEAYAVFLAGFGLVIGLAYLIPAVSMLVAGFFLDDVAEKIERADYPADPPGRPLGAGTAILEVLRFAVLALGVNLLALLMLFIPVVNLFAFFAANGWLLGREYFSLAASRFRTPEETRALRERHSGTVTLAGLLIAGFVAVPILNLFTPLFGTALMVHVHKTIERRERAARLA